MQVKKFEAPTIQEALDTIKRELGPEAIILQTKKHKRGFGLMSRASVEVTAAVSERSITKKTITERKIPEESKKAIQSLPAGKQASVYDKYIDTHMERALRQTQDRVEVNAKAKAKITATRYADIDDPVVNEDQYQKERRSFFQKPAPRTPARAQAPVQAEVELPKQKLPPSPASSRPGAAATYAGKFGDFSGHGSDSGQDSSSGQADQTGSPQNSLQNSLKEEVSSLKRMIAEMKNVQDDSLLIAGAQANQGASDWMTPALKEILDQLLLNGVERKYATALVRKSSFELGPERGQDPEQVLDHLAVELMQSTKVLNPLTGVEPKSKTGYTGFPKIICLVGPTGVGKTTTVAKLASEALLKKNLKVGLINLDSYKVAAFDHLATYARILNMPFRSATSIEDLNAAIKDFASLDLVLIDTTGRSQRDPAALREMEQTIRALPDAQTHLVVSATTRDAELYDTANRFSVFKPQGIIVSKLDEATIYGSIYNICQKAKLPLLYFTTGQRVPEDIEEATRERVASLVMDL